jgi:hypothetical protein
MGATGPPPSVSARRGTGLCGLLHRRQWSVVGDPDLRLKHRKNGRGVHGEKRDHSRCSV